MELNDLAYEDRNREIPKARRLSALCGALAWTFGVAGCVGTVIATADFVGSGYGRAHAGDVVFVLIGGLVATAATVAIFASLAVLLNVTAATHRQQYATAMAEGHLVTSSPGPLGSDVPEPLSCPNCSATITGEDDWSTWVCATCGATISAVACDACDLAYTVLGNRHSACRRCGATWPIHVHDITIAELRLRIGASDVP